MCPTYGRVGLLEESIESFLRQDYTGPKELLIINDLSEQHLTCSEPGVRVINQTHRFSNLGEKRNFAAKHSSGDLIMTWSDDDIHLPNRISSNVREWEKGRYVTEGSHIFMCVNTKVHKKGRMYGPFLMGRDEFWDLGGIPDAFTGEDLKFLNKVQKKLDVVEAKETSYIYRWGVTDRFHASWFDQKNDAWEQIRSRVSETLKNGKEPTGEILLRPHWKEDYQKLSEQLMQA